MGPDLDASFAQARADGMDNDTIEGVVQTQISNPRATEEGAANYDRVYMPADIVTGQDAEDVATYVASVAGVPGAKPPQLAPADLFAEKCGICHTFEAAGTNASTGPDLDQALAGKDAAYIEQQIIDPNSAITQGFSEGIMPQDFEQTLTPGGPQGLVEYLLDNVRRRPGRLARRLPGGRRRRHQDPEPDPELEQEHHRRPSGPGDDADDEHRQQRQADAGNDAEHRPLVRDQPVRGIVGHRWRSTVVAAQIK